LTILDLYTETTKLTPGRTKIAFITYINQDDTAVRVSIPVLQAATSIS
jgi:hypothetical protein